MAKFNPDQQQLDPQFSRIQGQASTARVKADTSLGEIFEAAGGIGNDIVQAANLAITEDINQTAREQADKVTDEFIRASGLASEVRDFGSREPAADLQRVPDQLRGGFDRAALLTRAFQQGKIRESNYWARLDEEARKLKSRFSGYKDEIDTRFSQLTGRRPANALRASLAREVASASTGDKFLRQERKDLMNMATKLGMTAVVERAVSDPDFSNSQLRVLVTRRNAIDVAREDELEDYNLAKAKGENTQLRAVSAARKEIYDAIGSAYQEVAVGVGKDVQTFTKDLLDLNAKGSAATPQEKQDLKARFNGLKLRLNQIAQQVLNRDRGNGVIYADDIKDKSEIDTLLAIPERFLAPLEEALFDKDNGIVKYGAFMLEAMQNETTLRVLSENPELLDLNSIKDLIGKPLFDLYVSQPGVLNSVKKIIVSAANSRLTSGRSSSVKDVLGWAKRMGIGLKTTAGEGTANRGIILNAVATVMRNEATADQKRRNAIGLYMSGSDNVLNAFSTTDDKNTIFNILSQKALVSAVDTLSDPKVIELQKRWMRDGFTTLSRSFINDLKKDPTAVTFENGRFKVSLGKFEAPSPGLFDTSGAAVAGIFGDRQRLLNAQDRLNLMLDRMENVFSPSDLQELLRFLEAPGFEEEEVETE